jgi:AGZA family xanthine/uracil permease-like MFS transporter
VEFGDLVEAVPAFATVAMTIFTYNIANGLAAGLVAAPLARLAAGRGREVGLAGWLLGAICLAYFVGGLRH